MTTRSPIQELPPASAEPYENLLEQAHRRALDYLARLDSSPVAAQADLSTLRAGLARPLPEQGIAAEKVLDDLVADAERGLLGSPGGRFFGWVIGGTLPVTVAADWLTSVWDQNGAVYATSPATAVVEEVVGAWLKDLLRLPAHASYALVSGCQMAHVTGLAAARHAVLVRAGWDLEQNGLAGSPPMRVLASEARHGSVARALRLLGIGRAQIVDLATDAMGRVEPRALEAALEQNAGAATIVILQAGQINTGSSDPFEELIPMAHARNAWVHVDGAFGLWAAASEQQRPRVRGVEAADSWATDGHKWLNVPHDCGFAFVAHPDAHRAAMSHRSSYVVYDSDARDEMEWNPEWSRRARGFAVYAALRNLGRTGVSALIDRCCRHARTLGERIGRLPGAELLGEPALNQALVRFLDPRPGATEAGHARQTDATIAAINATGEAFFTASTWKGRRVMRISVSNWRTSDQDEDRVIRAVEKILAASRA